jgi:hypothetical protein
VSRVDDLVENYTTFVNLPWQSSLAAPQRVWMAVYPPESERRLRLHVQAFANATQAAGYSWHCIDISKAFEEWMASHEYRDAYFDQPELLITSLPSFMDVVAEDVRAQLEQHGTSDSVVGLVGAASLFGLGDQVKLSALVNRVQDAVQGRLLVFFPGEHEGNSYRLLGAGDGWNYLATAITAEKG